MQMEGLHTVGCGLVPQGDCYDTAVSTPVSCSLQHDTFHLDLGRPEPHWPACVVATLIRVYPPQLLLPPTWPRVEYESTIPWGTDEGLDLWETGASLTHWAAIGCAACWVTLEGAVIAEWSEWLSCGENDKGIMVWFLAGEWHFSSPQSIHTSPLWPT